MTTAAAGPGLQNEEIRILTGGVRWIMLWDRAEWMLVAKDENFNLGSQTVAKTGKNVFLDRDKQA